jgi:hypothetical protein
MPTRTVLATRWACSSPWASVAPSPPASSSTTDPYHFICCIQHPSSGNEALWSFRTRPYAGSNGDADLLTGVNNGTTTGPGEFVKTARTLDVVNLRVDSSSGASYGRPFTLLLQAVSTSTGTFPYLPPLWMSPFAPIIPLQGGPVGQFLSVLPHGGSAIAVQVPVFLGGISVIAQGLIVAPNGTLLCTNAHEIVLR